MADDEFTELLNCIKQFQTEIATANEEAENWRQNPIEDERKIKKLAKLKQKMRKRIRESELEASRLRDEVQKAKDDLEQCDKETASCSAQIEAVKHELVELEEEDKELQREYSVLEGGLAESIVKARIELYKLAIEDKRKIDDKLALLDDHHSNGSRLESASALLNSMLSTFSAQETTAIMHISQESMIPVTAKASTLSESDLNKSMDME